jgi:hypothetical protein
MDGYVKGFVGASLVYFMTGAVLGFLSATGNAGGGTVFAHVHLNLLGFMTMMIYGVGYFIIPRFNATTLRWPGILPYHFWIANAGLILMVATYSTSQTLFSLGAASQVIAVFLFCVHILATIYGRRAGEDEERGDHPSSRKEEGFPAPAGVARRVDPDMRVGEILENLPGALAILVEGGLTPLADPQHAEQVKQMPVTLRTACMRHGIDLDRVLEQLETFAARTPATKGGVDLPGQSTLIKNVLEAHPETESVFRKHFGEGCFSCPGQAFESIHQSALMHNIDPDRLLDEIRAVISRGNDS